MSEYSLASVGSASAYEPALEIRRPNAAARRERSVDAALRRALDISMAFVGLLFLLPLLVLVGLAIKLEDGGPIIFSQDRLGLDGRLFKCWKFRSMVTDAQKRLDDLLAVDPEARAEWLRDHKLKKDPRITSCGRFLRKSSIDEIPQLMNVIIGDMSIVGPRPIVAAEIPRYASRFADYCQVKPGLTGLWQVSGRNNTTYRRRVAMDVVYIRNRSIWMDLRIILATIPAVLQSRGSY